MGSGGEGSHDPRVASGGLGGGEDERGGGRRHDPRVASGVMVPLSLWRRDILAYSMGA